MMQTVYKDDSDGGGYVNGYVCVHDFDDDCGGEDGYNDDMVLITMLITMVV